MGLIAEACRSGSEVLFARLPQEKGGNEANIELCLAPRRVHLRYPLPEVLPEKIVSRGFDKEADLNRKLLGVKGQYLIFQDLVFNVRRHEGYVTEVFASPKSF
jgi:Protein of unknown function (DUF2797)